MAHFDSELKNITEEGVPSKRVSDIRSARSIVERLIDEDQKRDQVRALVKGLVDGNPPYSQNALNRNKQGHRSNYNSGASTVVLDQAVVPYYELFTEVEKLGRCQCTHPDLTRRQDIEGIVTEEFDRLQRDDDDLDYTVQRTLHDMILYGAGPQVWDGVNVWKSTARHTREVLVPKDTKAEVDKWEMCVVKETFRPHELYRFIHNEKEAQQRGWSIEGVRGSIVKSMSHQTMDRNWETAQQELRNNDLIWGHNQNDINIGRIFYKEFNDQISELWVDRSSEDLPFLFKGYSRYKSWREVINPFMLSRGDGSYHSIKGLGVRMYAMLLAMERLLMQINDSTFFSTSVHARQQSQRSRNPQIHGPLTKWPDDLEPIVGLGQGMAQSLEIGMGVRRELDSLLQANLAQFKAQVAQPKGNPRTAFEVAANVAQQSVLTKMSISKFYKQLDTWYNQRFQRALRSNEEDAKSFQQALQQRGVTQAELKQCKVKAERASGQGSAIFRTQNLNELIGTVGASLPEAGLTNLLRDKIAASAGQEKVDRYYPLQGPSEEIAEQRQEALGENTDARVGGVLEVSGVDNHIVHAELHLEGAAGSLDALQKGGSLEDTAAFLAVILPHTERHIGLLEGDSLRVNEAQALQQRLNELKALANQIAQQAQAQARQRAQGRGQEQQMTQEGKKLEFDMQLEAAKMSQELKLKELGQQNEMALDRAKVQSDIQLDQRKTESDIQLQEAKARAAKNGSTSKK